MPTKTGIFTQDEANTGHLFSYRLAQYIGKKLHKPKVIFDMGCGIGSYCRYLKDIGFTNVVGIEGANYENLEFKPIIVKDLTEAFDLGKGNVMSIEVGEHIPKEFEQTFINNVVAHCDEYLFLSWAHEGQQGYGHVNCRPDWWVIEQITKRGFIHVEELTIEIRSVIEGPYAYLKENLFVFKKL